MSESRQISTQTVLNVVGSSISILTKYTNTIEGDIIQVFISEVFNGELVDGVSFIEGELGISLPTDSTLITSIDNEGNLIITSSDASQYSIDPNTGQLIYTY